MRQVSIELQNKIQANKVLHLTKVKHGTGKHVLTIGTSDHADKKRYPWMIVDYNKDCKSGKHLYFSHKAFMAQYLIDFCGRNTVCDQLGIFEKRMY